MIRDSGLLFQQPCRSIFMARLEKQGVYFSRI